ncbi:TetR family transcriptional regulator [Bacteroidia bacterium]|nr:TetR family transcriptional regulator [Bacteroidia bacterium]
MKMEENMNMEERIIEAAKLVFVRKGYKATTMVDIAAEVGISRTALHYYFHTKEVMFEAIFAQLIGTLLPNIDMIMDEENTILEKLPAFIDAYLAALLQNQLFPLFVINEMNRDPAHLFSAVVKNISQIQPLIRLQSQLLDEMERGLLNKVPLEDVVSTFIGLIIFPILVRNPLVTVFMNGEDGAFDKFISRRKQLIYDVIYHLLAPYY